MMRLVVTGKHGLLASSLRERGRNWPGGEVIALGRPELDLERPESVEAALAAARPDVIVNAAAYTAVDKAESEPDRAFAINRDGAEAVARAAAKLGIPVIHISTDYVFDGEKREPYVETDTPNPINVYGKSKLAGEQAVQAAHPAAVILRTSWVFSPYGNNFLKTMLRLGAERDVLRVVDDQYGNPTSALDLADAILHIAPTLKATPGAGGVYHYAGEGSTTWYGFARFISEESVKHGGPSPTVDTISTSEHPTAARRTHCTRFCTRQFTTQFNLLSVPWRNADIWARAQP